MKFSQCPDLMVYSGGVQGTLVPRPPDLKGGMGDPRGQLPTPETPLPPTLRPGLTRPGHQVRARPVSPPGPKAALPARPLRQPPWSGPFPPLPRPHPACPCRPNLTLTTWPLSRPCTTRTKHQPPARRPAPQAQHLHKVILIDLDCLGGQFPEVK